MNVSRLQERIFDRSRLSLRPLADRQHDLDLGAIRPLQPVTTVDPELAFTAARMKQARNQGAACIWMLGAHVLRSGMQHYLIDLMERGYIQAIALNGAGVIHDYEFARIGATTESVARYIAEGQFGLWQETGAINDLIVAAAKQELGLGLAVGRAIEDEAFSHRDISILAAGYRLGVPITVHVGIGYDIIHEHPNCDGAALGAASYRDFLKFAAVMEQLEGGVVATFGSAVMAPEVYLKALAMVRNVAHQEGRSIRHFTTLVCDLHDLGEATSQEPARDNPQYYYRPWKTMLARTVADGGESFYVRGRHEQTIPSLWTALST